MNERGPTGDHGQTGQRGEPGAKGERGDREKLPLAVRYATAAWLIMAAGVVGMGAWLYHDYRIDQRRQTERDKIICSVATHNRADANGLKDSLRRAYTLPFIPKPSSAELMKTVPADAPPITCDANGKVDLPDRDDVPKESPRQKGVGPGA